MEKTTVLILAAGGHGLNRFDEPCKQLLPVGDETIIERLQRQVKARGLNPLVITHRQAIKTVSSTWFEPTSHRRVSETLLNTSSFWQETTTALLGDVVLSRRAMDRILLKELPTEDSPLLVFGNTGEIFAVSFVSAAWGAVESALRRASGYRFGKLRQFYRAYCGLPLGFKTKKIDPHVYRLVTDWSMDVDKPGEYRALMSEIVRKGILDDLRSCHENQNS